MNNVLIASYDMEVGGVERSLAGMLNEFDFSRYDVDLMLYRHRGDFMELLPSQAKLLKEIPEYASFRYSISETLRKNLLALGMTRLMSKAHAAIIGRLRGISEPGYLQQQFMWKYALPFLPDLERQYDVAISYLWPHYFVAEKVKANLKIAWIHTDYSTVNTDVALDLRMWKQFDAIIAVSEACKFSFLAKYEELTDKVHVIENIASPETIRAQALVMNDSNPMLKDERFKLLTVARLSHAKGIDNAVRALKLLRERGHNQLVWYVVGYGGDEAEIRHLISEHGLESSFILLGKQTNPYPYMAACDLYVQPSRYEGKAVTVTEAQILGKPVMITNYSTASSQVAHCIDGYITELSVEGIAEGILNLYNSNELRQRLALNCSRQIYGSSGEMEILYDLIGFRRREMV